MANLARDPQYEYIADRFMAMLTVEDRDEINEHIARHTTAIGIHRLFNELRSDYALRGVALPEVSLSGIDRWHKARHKKGKKAQEIEALANGLEGLDPEKILQFAMYGAVAFAGQHQEALCTDDLIEGVKGESLLNAWVTALKEARAGSTFLLQQRERELKRQLELSGIYLLARTLREQTKDTTLEVPLKDYLDAAIAVAEDRCK